MAEVYVTLGEAAELERVKYNTMVKRVLRKQESFVTKTEKSENGGKDVVLVAVSSLSKQARNAYETKACSGYKGRRKSSVLSTGFWSGTCST